ncbi:DNA methyltransferase [Nisaea sediminum]|uniref:DNA methyltransferase n=1 Tax=Nisaea sediminum TaxID=2775867 RepID=UPI001D028022|nr:DNA methyltransferase [Nisaea sediminum]
MTWNHEMRAAVARFAAETTLSTAAIGAEIGKSKDAVIGFLHRNEDIWRTFRLRRGLTVPPPGPSEDPYRAFLEAKIRMADFHGFDIGPEDVNPILKPHQVALVIWAVKGGRRAIFAAFGLGKSLIQLEIIRIVSEYLGGRGLIVAPLGVRAEFLRDAELLRTGNHPDITDEQREALRKWREWRPDRLCHITFIRSIEQARDGGLYLTNYETVREGKLDPADFVVTSLDEASVLRSYGSKTFQTFLPLFDAVPFRFVATATPAPNRYKELVHYAGYLGVMDTGQALTRFFKRDSKKANKLTLFPHKEQEFWLWLASWAAFVAKPSDLGFSDEGYDLPPLSVVEHEVTRDVIRYEFERDGQGRLIEDAAVGVVDAARVKRESIPARVAEMVRILEAAPADHFILWHDLEAERHAIAKAVPSAVSVYGSQDLEDRETAIADFSDGRSQYLSAKPIIAGSGTNLQRHCHKAVFVGIGHKFNDFIQSIHRIQRFLQRHPVEVHVIFTEAERETWRDLQRKWSDHERMVEKMTEIVRKYGLNQLAMAEVLSRSIGVDRIEAAGDAWLFANNDCVEETKAMDTNSVDLVVTSIPFSNHYEYVASYNDFGHTDDNGHFWGQMDHLTPELLRVMKPGRIACIHVKDRILFGNVTGYGRPTVSPFHAEAIFHYQRHGFLFMGMITVITDVVRENNQTYRLGYTEMRKDATKMGVGSPEYVLLFAKPQSDLSKGYADQRVAKSAEDYSLARWQVDAHAFWRSSGERLMTPDELARLGPDALAKAFTEWSLKGVYDYEAHVRIGEALEARGALPSSFMSLAPGSADPDVWHDVNRMRTLNGAQAAKGREMHVCPLQFDIVDRLIERYSAKGELVFDPFGGIATVPVRALKLGRRGRAVELHHQYFLDGVSYLQAMERKVQTPGLFDVIEAEAAVGGRAA